MSFDIPNLDRKSYPQLVAELIRRIPQYTTQWTDYNDSDPGITLLQLLAWLDDSLLYQANAIPIQNDQNYLRWVLGLAFSSNETSYSKVAVTDNDFDFLALQQVLTQMEQGAALSRETLQQDVLAYVQQPYMALTLSNVDTLAMQTNLVIAQQQKKKPADPPSPLVRQAYAQSAGEGCIAYVLSDAKWRYQYPYYPNQQQYKGSSTTLRKLLMIQPQDDAKAEKTLLDQVTTYLKPRVIAGNQVWVRAAQLTDINLALTVRCAANTRVDVTLTLLFATLFRYFLPCEGGTDGQGWAYGEAPVADEIRHLVFSVPGIDAIDSFDFNFIPTMELDTMATLDVNAQLADLPPGEPAMFYRGLPRLRCLDVIARSSQA
ncbi:hypothetical protein [Collimonas silvisoli]|uniref:hypothetical protein n=1 Tax=Collimonas silvisoli TaxID=2825884 RepID=UPI001B8BEC7E|nr:hypothetical protein [Collimonas silvisoli]